MRYGGTGATPAAQLQPLVGISRADAWQQADRVMYEAKLRGKNRAEYSVRDSRAA